MYKFRLILLFALPALNCLHAINPLEEYLVLRHALHQNSESKRINFKKTALFAGSAGAAATIFYQVKNSISTHLAIAITGGSFLGMVCLWPIKHDSLHAQTLKEMKCKKCLDMLKEFFLGLVDLCNSDQMALYTQMHQELDDYRQKYHDCDCGHTHEFDVTDGYLEPSRFKSYYILYNALYKLLFQTKRLPACMLPKGKIPQGINCSAQGVHANRELIVLAKSLYPEFENDHPKVIASNVSMPSDISGLMTMALYSWGDNCIVIYKDFLEISKEVKWRAFLHEYAHALQSKMYNSLDTDLRLLFRNLKFIENQADRLACYKLNCATCLELAATNSSYQHGYFLPAEYSPVLQWLKNKNAYCAQHQAMNKQEQ